MIHLDIIETKRGRRIRATGSVGPFKHTVRQMKAVGAGRWDGKNRYWHFPLEVSVCRRFRETFQTQLTIDPALNAWAYKAIKRERKRAKLAGASSTLLTYVPMYAPMIHEAMSNRPYQQICAAFGTQAGSFLLGDQQGLGKTLEVLATLIESAGPRPGRQRRHLVLCPLVAVELVWGPEVASYIPEEATAYLVTGTRAQRQKALSDALSDVDSPHVIVICNIEMVRQDYPELFPKRWSWHTVIVDESHRCLIRTRGKQSQTRTGMMRLTKCSQTRIACSGTYMRGKPEQFWGTLNWLRPDLFTSYWQWIALYFAIKSDGYSDYVISEMLPGAEERMQADCAFMVLRRTKAEVLPELPPKQYIGSHILPDDKKSPYGVWLPLRGPHKTQYKLWEEDSSLDFEDGLVIAATLPMVDYTRKRQLAWGLFTAKEEIVKGTPKTILYPTLTSPKYEWILQFLTELGMTEGDKQAKVIISSASTKVIEVLAEGLAANEIASYQLTGKTSNKARVAMKDDWQNNNDSDVRVFLLNKQAGGVALTLDAADYVIHIDESTIPDEDEQVEDRAHRTSRMHQVFVIYLRTRDTQDEEIAWVSSMREDRQKYIMDGARGVSYARSRYGEWRRNTPRGIVG